MRTVLETIAGLIGWAITLLIPITFIAAVIAALPTILMGAAVMVVVFSVFMLLSIAWQVLSDRR